MNPFACKKPFAYFPIAAAILVTMLSSHPCHAFDAAAPQANRFAVSIAPAERFEVDGVLVEQYGKKAGSKGRPLVLIPGLATGGWVWQETVRAFSAEHVLYVLTLPGFDGRPAAGPTPFASAQAAVARLIAERRLDKPVIVGHSLGATMAIALAAEQPAAIGGVVAIDGLPVFPGTENMEPAQRQAMAEGMKTRMAGTSPQVFASQQQAYMRAVGVVDMGKADDLARLTGRSDPASVAQYMADDLKLDLRPGLKNIQAPVLVIAPWFDLDNTVQGQTITQDDKRDYYRSLMAGTPKLDVVTVAPARHFAMIDQPQQVNDAIRKYLSAL
jgi:pimeloyl-ACP methyl ester carboxylesterase